MLERGNSIYLLQGRSEQAKVGGGDLVSHFRISTTLHSLINISFPKIVGQRGGGGGRM